MKRNISYYWSTLLLCFSLVILEGASQQCGWQAGGIECPNKLCCSSAGYCGTTPAYCGDGCQSNCHQSPPPAPPPPTPPSNLTKIISQELFEEFLMHRNTAPCTGGFYSYYAFITAANSFPEFGNTGDLETRKREIAAFFGQTSHETTGGWPTAPDGPQAWGYCWVKERGCEGDPSPCTGYCQPSTEWPCAPGKAYYGRGPMQLSYNYNYGPAGRDLSLELLTKPDLVSDDPVIAFKAALWFWMTPQSPKPSCHDVITGQWTPNPSDIAGNRLPGYGVLINIINGGLECNIPSPDARVEDRILFYQRYCQLLDVSPGDHLDCYNQRPFNWGLTFGGISSS